ncbi:MAG: hypothetical protein M3371_11625 [Acidobacteriota bacterium]|nr:hypothetical protein [Acidobacteriota bacterium]
MWVEESLLWLIDEFGSETLRNVSVVLPTEEFFPDPYSEDEEGVRLLINKVCGYMGVDPGRLEVEFFADERNELRHDLPSCEFSHGGAAGQYRKRRGKFVISVESSQSREPMNLVATVAHELGHVLLLGGGRASPRWEDHEPLTDLLTVFLGMGVFTGNTAFRFSQWTDAFSQGWQAERSGYLTEAMFGYALALFAWARGEQKPSWPKYLKGNVAAYFKSGHKYLEKTGDTLLKRL